MNVLKVLKRFGAVTLPDDVIELSDLVSEYERIRASMPPSNERTRKMEETVAKMRKLGLTSTELLPDLTSSESAGDHLAATVILKDNPRPEYLLWLAAGLSDQPFIGYHAAEALLYAVKALKDSHYQELENALRTAKHNLDAAAGDKKDRRGLLEAGERELSQA